MNNNIEPFNLSTIKPCSKILIIGVHSTGKTTLAKELYKIIEPNVL
jgi:uridine kinase